MTPEFWAKIETGLHVINPAVNPASPSAATPPWILLSKTTPVVSCLDASALAVMSPAASTASTVKTQIPGMIAGAKSDNLKV